MTLFRWRFRVASECWFEQLRLSIKMMGIATVSVWYLAQRLKIQQVEDIGTTISVFEKKLHRSFARELQHNRYSTGGLP